VALELLTSVLIVFGIALLVGLVCNRLKVPPLVAFIITGIIAGPYALSLIRDTEQVQTLAEMGIILLLFTIGLEFSFSSLWKIRGVAIVAGSIQVFLTFLFFFAIATLLGMSVPGSILLGCLFSLSSTAIVLKILHQKGEMESPHGSIILGILIFQDLIAIPMMMAIPFLAEMTTHIATAGIGGDSIFIVIAKDILLVLILIVAAKWVIPWLLHEIAVTRNQELFLVFIIIVCFGVALLVSFSGISLAIGALLAGLLISGSEYSHQATSLILPFRDIFTSFFFISVGMLVNIWLVLDQIVLVTLLILAIIFAKSVIAAAAPLLMGYPIRTAAITGLALAQIGEFSLILAQSGFSAGIIPENSYQMFLIITLITMAATPFVYALSPRIAENVDRLPILSRLKDRNHVEILQDQVRHLKDHLVIIGFGVTGRNLARAAKSGGIEYTIIELNPDYVRDEREKGEPIIFGDATYDGVLEHADIRTARIVVISINDPVATWKILANCRALNPNICIIVRTRYVSEVPGLLSGGADEVVAEEFETSIEIFTRVLDRYYLPQDRIDQFIGDVRADGYRMLRSRNVQSGTFCDLTRHIPDIHIQAFTVSPGSPLAGTTLGEFNLRKRFGILVLAIKRGDTIVTKLSGETELEPGDHAIVFGTLEDINKATSLFESGGTSG
jgi:CPA2 family monovalent cation:H+ antiporter-2